MIKFLGPLSLIGVTLWYVLLKWSQRDQSSYLADSADRRRDIIQQAANQDFNLGL